MLKKTSPLFNRSVNRTARFTKKKYVNVTAPVFNGQIQSPRPKVFAKKMIVINSTRPF